MLTYELLIKGTIAQPDYPTECLPVKQLPRLLIYILILAATALIPSRSVAKSPEQDIIKVPELSLLAEYEKPIDTASFALATQLDTIVVAAPVLTPVVSTGSINCGSDPNQILVYTRESGCSTTATNSQGCYGLGQDCNGIVRALCGSDWTCQNQYFTTYMLNRYGSWSAAWQMELSSGWW